MCLPLRSGRHHRRDTAALLQLIDPDLEWTYLVATVADPEPQVCHGGGELEIALSRQAARGLRSELEEVIGRDDKVMLVLRTPGMDAYRAKPADDRSYDVLTLRGGKVVALRACHDRDEARSLAGID